jgi:hypothetical protein
VIAMGDCIERAESLGQHRGVFSIIFFLFPAISIHPPSVDTRLAESLGQRRCLLLHLHYSFHGAIFVDEKHDRIFSTLNNFSVEVGNFYQYFRAITQLMDSCKIQIRF